MLATVAKKKIVTLSPPAGKYGGKVESVRDLILSPPPSYTRNLEHESLKMKKKKKLNVPHSRNFSGQSWESPAGLSLLSSGRGRYINREGFGGALLAFFIGLQAGGERGPRE